MNAYNIYVFNIGIIAIAFVCCEKIALWLFTNLTLHVLYDHNMALADGLSQVDELTADLHSRSSIPKHVEDMIRAFPKDMHAMSMFGAALFAMQVGQART